MPQHGGHLLTKLERSFRKENIAAKITELQIYSNGGLAGAHASTDKASCRNFGGGYAIGVLMHLETNEQISVFAPDSAGLSERPVRELHDETSRCAEHT